MLIQSNMPASFKTEIEVPYPQWITEAAGIHVSSFGVIGDGKTDDSLALNRAFSYVIEHGQKLLLDDASYLIKTPLVINISSISCFAIIGKPNKQTRFIGDVPDGEAVVTVQLVNPPFASENIIIENIHIKPTNEKQFKIDGLKIIDTIGVHYKGIYIERCRSGFLFTDTAAGYTELNIFERCYSAQNDYGYHFKGSADLASFHGNKFISCGFGSVNYSTSKGYSRNFLQYGLYLERGYIYNCYFDLYSFMENGACLIYINSNGGFNYGRITYENFKSPYDSSGDTPKSKIMTGVYSDARFRIVGDIIGIGSNNNELDYTGYSVTATGAERLITNGNGRSFRATGIEHFGKENVVYGYENKYYDLNAGAIPKLYHYHNKSDITEEAGLIAMVRGTDGRFIVGKTTAGASADQMEKGFEIFGNGEQIKSVNTGRIKFLATHIQTGNVLKNVPNVVQGTAAPASAPEFVGQMFINTSSKVAYIACGLNTSDWKQITNA